MKVVLYDSPSVQEVKIKRLESFLKKTFPIKVEIRWNFFTDCSQKTLQQMECCRIFNHTKPFKNQNQDMQRENHDQIQPSMIENPVIYDGFELLKTFSELISIEENNLDTFHIFFTDKLIGSYDYDDSRYHARALISSNPSIISITGIIEAPAKSMEYYFDLITSYKAGSSIDLLKEKYRGEFLEKGDPRLAKIIEGYALQAIFYFETTDPFCDKKECRLYNAHWQKELLVSQIKRGVLCERHEKILQELNLGQKI